MLLLCTRKIPKISRGELIFFKGLFRGAYFWTGWAYQRRKICVSKSFGLALWLEVNLPFLLFVTLYLSAIFHEHAPGELMFRGAI